MKQAGGTVRIDKQRYYETKPGMTGSGRLDLIKACSAASAGEFRRWYCSQAVSEDQYVCGAEA